MTHERSPMDDATRHRECWERLPWLVNETLDAREHARIEAHLRACRECQEELALQRNVRDAIRSEEPVILAPQAALQKLMQRIDTDETSTDVEAPGREGAGPSPRTAVRWPRWVAVAAGLQGAAIALLLLNQWRTPAEDLLNAPRFTTLSEPEAGAGPVIRVVFAAGVALNDVNAILRSVDAQIVAGPSEAGVYTLALRTGTADVRPDRIGDALDMNNALARLRADSRVLFAESALTRTAP